MASKKQPGSEEKAGVANRPSEDSKYTEYPSFPQHRKCTKIFFIVKQKLETALVPLDSSSDDVKDLFRSAAEAGAYDIVKLYNSEGKLLNISPFILPNSSENPYRLQVAAVHCNEIIMEQVGVDLESLEKRLSQLEKIFKQQSSPYEDVHLLKTEVNQLRYKLENYEHLSFLGFYKALHPPPLQNSKGSQVKKFNTISKVSTSTSYHRNGIKDKQTVCDKFLQISDAILTTETCRLLRELTFDNWQWEDEEMLVLLQQMYLDLELPKKFDIEINILRNFLVKVYHHYHYVPFHNFRHCFCVTQMMFGLAWSLNLPDKIGDLEILILLTSACCHDLDHPGYNNIYQINAQTELALRYNDISPLENHHCSIAFRILEDPECNIFRNLSTDTYKKIREGMIRCILATDMARHNEIVNQFKEIIPHFDYSNKTHVNLLSMVLIKVADISNEARPIDVAEPWLECLLTEFYQQSDTEKLEGLPVTPFMDREKISKPQSQVSFIGLVLLPLFEALGALFTELEALLLEPVRVGFEYYRRMNEATKHRKSTDTGNIIGNAGQESCCDSTISETDGSEAKIGSNSKKEVEKNNESLTATASQLISYPNRRLSTANLLPTRRASHSHVHKGSTSHGSLKMLSQLYKSNGSNIHSLQSLESDNEMEDSSDSDMDDITEVAVSEKTLKFKIATESSFDFTSSRKGSRDNKSEGSIRSISVNTCESVKDDNQEIKGSMGKDALSVPSKSSHLRETHEVEPNVKLKSKDSFLSRLKMFTERLSISVDSTGPSSTPEKGTSSSSPTNQAQKFQSFSGLNYFRRSRRKGGSKICSTTGPTSGSAVTRPVKHRGSCSDPEGHPSYMDKDEYHRDFESEQGSCIVSSECSPALSGPCQSRDEGNSSGLKSWKHCSGSLDSVLSKDEVKKSPSRKLMLPRFSSFVQKKTRMGFRLRKSCPRSSDDKS